MKRNLASFVVCFGFVACLCALMPKSLPDMLPDAEQFWVYCRSSKLSAEQCGNGMVVKATADNVGYAVFCSRNVDGITAKVSESLQSVASKLMLQVYSEQKLGNVTVVCGYSPVVSGGVLLDGKKVNVQIAQTPQGVFVGCPLILGSY